ncbi:growth-regulating factor 5-like [Impatiens glandulifera]|uniref:growth-regulating factor 5-like n=1 Tax=Impatiens glandulifera TaxID=253017 RepID=UPI001FB19F8C|nr:growth-regulating factor 5-like [Impatiens glandulifera]
MNGGISYTYRFPFTAIQWQELEHQALIYKYIISGIPIPPDLLFSVKTSLDSSSSLPQHVGWNSFQMGSVRKIDPEPGRCRRTDGKKWRCSKEAYPDSKYCERHMHRGRNRSRKPVEAIIKPSINKPQTSFLPLSMVSDHHGQYFEHSSTSRSPRDIGLSLCQDNTSSTGPMLLDFGLCSNPDRYNNEAYGGMKEDDGLFFEASGRIRRYLSFNPDDHWQLKMGHSSTTHLKQPYSSSLQYGYQGLNDNHLATHIEDKPQKKIMHSFFDECPKNKDS